MRNVWLHRYTVVVAICTLLLVVAGGLVTSNDAGLSAPDWPLSYGKLMPKMEGGVFFEHGHRMVATTVGLLTIILAIWLWRADGRRWIALHSLAPAVPLCILPQLALGAAARHRALGVLPHVIGASVVTGMILWIVLRVTVTS